MPEYDFQCLSPREFEKLSKQLLDKKLGVNFEVFKEGKDQGIDLLLKSKGKTIVQCKRYEPAAYKRLKRVIEKEELVKIKKHAPARYILFTSVKLSLANKEELLKILTPYCTDTSDIYGVDEVNGLLADYPEAEEANFKLWLTSTPVLQKVLHANIANFSDHGVQYIKQSYSRFVVNSSVEKANIVLKAHHYCIIAGKPGIGKTTLAHVLLSQFIADGYEMVSVSHDIEEAWTKRKHGKKQVFYYDDFLGQTSLETKLAKNEDDRLLKFIESIETTKESFFILTTREYILNQAAITYEKIGRKADSLKKCIIELEDYTNVNKAEILYNHIFFSTLDTAQKLELLNPDIYKEILNHENYYPRLIEDITARDFFKKTAGSNFGVSVVAYFDNPSAIWERAFNALSVKAQVLLLVLTTFPYIAHYPDLEAAFNAAYSYFSKKKGWAQGFDDYTQALRELDGSPVRVTKTSFATFSNTKKLPNEGYVVEFENPSIRDYLENQLLTNGELAKDLFLSSLFFEQTIYLMDLRVGKERKSLTIHLAILKENLLTHAADIFDRSLSRVKELGFSTETKCYAEADWCPAERMSRLITSLTHSDLSDQSHLVKYITDFLNDISHKDCSLRGLVRLTDAVKVLNQELDTEIDLTQYPIRNLIEESIEDLDDWELASQYILTDHNSGEVQATIEAALLEAVEEVVSDKDASLEIVEDLQSKLQHFSSVHHYNLDYLETQLSDKEMELQQREAEKDDDDYAGDAHKVSPEPSTNNKHLDDLEIRGMFQQLAQDLQDIE